MSHPEVRCLYDHEGRIFHVDHGGDGHRGVHDSRAFWAAIKDAHASGRLMGVAYALPNDDTADPTSADIDAYQAVDKLLGGGVAWLIVAGRSQRSWDLRRKGDVREVMAASGKVITRLRRFIIDQLDGKAPDPAELVDGDGLYDVCGTCGACCNFGDNSFHVLGVKISESDDTRVPPELTTNFYAITNRLSSLSRRTPRTVRGKFMIWNMNRCIAHRGEVGVASSCSIYEDRPVTCRDFPIGDPMCVWSRQMAGLSPPAPPGSFSNFVMRLADSGAVQWTRERAMDVASGSEPTQEEWNDLGHVRWGAAWATWARDSEREGRPLPFPE